MPTTLTPHLTALNAGLLIARLVLGLALAAHGAQKLFGWFGGHGLAGTGAFFETLGFRPGRLFAMLAGVAEFGGGVLTALGFLGPIGPALMLAAMIVAMEMHWRSGFFTSQNGIELPLLYAVGALALALTGPGAYSVDAAAGLEELWSMGVVWAAIAAAVVGSVGSLALRRPPARAAASH
jgi:putative oxidoreductase